MIGLFSGLAILNKWLPGLLVYAGWIILKLRNKDLSFKQFKDILVSLLITIMVALPWQIYIMIRFPVEAFLEYQLNSRHFFEVIEGHSGDIWYHLDNMDILFGKLSSFLIIPAFIVLYKQMKDKDLYYSLTGMVLLVFVFFTAAKTKMPSFTMIVSLIIFISFASLANYLIQISELKLKRQWLVKMLFAGVIILLIVTRFEFYSIKEKHTLWKEENLYSRALIHNKKIFSSLDLHDNTVLFNIRGQHYVDAMYYSGLPAYRQIPTYEQYMDLKKKGRIIAVFKTKDLPDYLANDPEVIIIDEKVDGYN